MKVLHLAGGLANRGQGTLNFLPVSEEDEVSKCLAHILSDIPLHLELLLPYEVDGVLLTLQEQGSLVI